MKDSDSNFLRRSFADATRLLMLLSLTLLALCSAAHAQFTTSTNNNQITITGYSGSGGAVSIPSTINGLPVIAIGFEAFFGCSSLTSVTIPDSVVTIGTCAFYDCTDLLSVTIGNGVTTIEDEAFMECTSLEMVTIGNSVTSIEYCAFYGSNLTSVVFLGNAPNMGYWVFGEEGGLPFIYYFDNATGFTSPIWDDHPTTQVGPPSISSEVVTGTVGTPFSCGIIATGFPISYAVTGLPAGLSCDPGTGLISGTPTEPGAFVSTVTATNPSGSGTGILSLTVDGPPAASSGTATGVAYNAATINGTVNPNGFATTVYFQYGTTTDYGSTTGTQSAGSGNTTASYSMPVTGLTPETTYHFQIVAANLSGTTFGVDQTFTTLNPPPTAATGTTSGVIYNVATLSGTVNPNGLSSTLYFQYGTTASYGSTTAIQAAGSGTTATQFSATLTGLNGATTYHYCIVGINSSGTSYGLDQTFTTLDPPPTVTTNVVSGIAYNAAILSGTVNPNGLSTTLYVQYGTTISYGSTTVTQNAGSGTTAAQFNAAIVGLNPSTIYHCQIVAANSSGTTCGLDRTFTTPRPPPTATTGTASGIAYNTVTLNGTVNPNGLSTTLYFQYGTPPSYGSNTAIQAAGSGTTAAQFSATLTGLNGATTCHYQIVAVNSSGTTYGSDQTFTTPNPPPTAVTGTASGIAYNTATLNGTVDPNGLSTTLYFQYGTTTSYGAMTVAQNAGNSMTAAQFNAPLTGLNGATTYHCQIVAANTSGTTYGLDQTFTTANPPPTAATGTANRIACNAATLNGTADPNGLSTTLYFQYGTTTSYGSTTAIQAAGSGTAAAQFSAAIVGLNPETTYHCQIVAANISGTTCGSDQTFTTLNPPPTAVTGTATGTVYNAATLNGTVNPNGLSTTLYFQFGTTTAYGSTTGVQSAGSGTNSAPFNTAIAGLNPETTYHYQIVAANTSGTTYGLDQTFTTANPPPTAATGATSGTTYNSATLNGTVNPNGLSTTLYFQYGTTTAYSSGTTGEQFAGSGTSAASFSAVIADLSASTIYHYQIVAANSSGTAYSSDQIFTTVNPPPTATTGSATGITSVSGILSGTVNPNGLTTTLYFQYGTSKTYSSTTAIQNAGNGTTALPFSAAIAGLNPATNYHFCLVAANTSGTSFGEDQVFTTANAAPTVTTGIATGVSDQGATLSGIVTSNGLPTTVCFQYGMKASYGTSTGNQVVGSGTSATPISSNIAGLKAAKLYHYRCVATNSLGTTYGNDETFTAAGAPIASTGAVTKMGANEITVCGTVVPNGLATTCFFEYGELGFTNLKTSKVAVGSGTAGRDVTAALAHLKPNQSYFYCLVAANRAGTVTGGTQTFVTGSALPSTPMVTVSGTGETVAAIDASLDTQGGLTDIFFQYGATKSYGKTTGSATLEASGPASTASVDLFALAPHTTYYVRCVAKNTLGTVYSTGTTFMTLPRFDMTGSGYSDLLLSDTATGETALLFGNGTVTGGTLMITGSEAGPAIPPGLTFCGEAEFNQDGTVAWVLSGSIPNQTVFLTSGTDGWTSNTLTTGTFSAPSGATVAGVGDFNGDGNPDLVLVEPNQKVTFWMLDSFTVIAQKAGPKLPTGFVITGLDDLNGNGKPDILIWNPKTGKTKILSMNGITDASAAAGPTIPTGWQLMGANVYTGTAPEWLLYNSVYQTTQVWTVKGDKVESAINGPDIPGGLNLLGTK